MDDVTARRASAPPLPGATKDEQSVTADWTVLQDPIDGVRLIEVRNVIRDSGHLTEILRRDWFNGPVEIDQVFQVTLESYAVSAWHVHLDTTDRLFATTGQVKVALFDAREESPTRGLVNEFRLGERRPGLVIVPAGVWHGLRNLRATPATVLNLVDRAYAYDDPDHWRLPPDTAEIPHRI
jgi:dTDP-4-dehydrorhamnose 3,5-epimerase